MKQVQGKEYIATYNEIVELKNQGYKLLEDLYLLIENGYIYKDNTQNIRTYIDHDEKLIDVFEAVAVKFVYDFKGNKKYVYYPVNDTYLVKE